VKPIVRTPDGLELVRVSVEVKFVDIWAVVDCFNGEQIELFSDREVLGERQPAFERERVAWSVRTSLTQH
jgi:hypothetical protein